VAEHRQASEIHEELIAMTKTTGRTARGYNKTAVRE